MYRRALGGRPRADGQKIQYEGRVRLLTQAPNHLLAQLESDRRDRQLLYDGENFTVFAPDSNYYATVGAPPTIGALIDKLEDEYGFDVPLVDLFRWGSSGWSADGIKSARDVGPSVVGDTTCEQYAFRQQGIDWQIWIQEGQFPLPRKLVITTSSDEARPQYTAGYTWNLAPSFDETAFTFDPPPGANRAQLADIRAK